MSMCCAMPFSACALKKTFLWRWYCGKKQMEMWFSVVCTLIDNEYASSQWSKFVVDSLGCIPWSQRFFLSRERATKRWRRVPKRREEKNLWLPWTWISLSNSRQGQDLTLRLGLVDTFYKHANQYDWFVWPVMPRGFMIAKLPLVPFVIINLTRLTAGVCMKVRFKSKVTRGFSLLAASRLSHGSRKTSGTRVLAAPRESTTFWPL